ncbi:MAG: phosphodiester glycosidase family protein [Bacteroidota bacterium]
MKIKLLLLFVLLSFAASAQKARKPKKAKRNTEQVQQAVLDSIQQRADSIQQRVDSIELAQLRDTVRLYYENLSFIDTLEQQLLFVAAENDTLRDSVALLIKEIEELKFGLAKVEASVFKSLSTVKVCQGIDFYELSYKGIPLEGVIIKDPSEIQLFHRDEQTKLFRSFDKLEKVAKKQKQALKFAMNGGMFEPTYNPVGLLIIDGVKSKALNLKPAQYGNFYLLPNGVFSIDSAGVARVTETTQFHEATPDSLRIATQSGPMLLIDGTIHPVFRRNSKNLRVRNGVGVNDKGEVVFVISKAPINLFSFAQVFQFLGCQNALYLDGTISEMYVSDVNPSTKHRGAFGPMIGVFKPAKCKE